MYSFSMFGKWSKIIEFFLLSLILAAGLNLTAPRVLQAQEIQPPDRHFLFIDDKDKRERERLQKQAKKAQRRAVNQQFKPTAGLPFDLNAENIKFDSEHKQVRAKDNVVMRYQSGTVEAATGDFDIDKKLGVLHGDVRMTEIGGSTSADAANLNIDNRTGTLENARMFFEDGNYHIHAKTAEKVSEDEFKFKDAEVSTCECPEGDASCSPWTLTANRGEVTQDGYGKVWGAVLHLYDVPVMYTPYLMFPVKNDRQSGFLAPTIGTGSKTGFKLQLPFFWAIDNSTDATITGILETETRVGVSAEFRKIFSKDNHLESGLTFLDETKRDGKLLGTNTDGLYDPTLDTHRLGGYVDQIWRGELNDTPFQFILDGAYVSDDLFLREFENEKIAPFNSRFVTSRAVFRTTLMDKYSLDLSSEYNQSLVSDDNFVFQRLPELSLTGLDVFRPFGEHNPLGAKLVLSSSADYVNFSRDRSYDGSRSEIYETLKLPFHLRNLFEAEVSTDARGSFYNMGERNAVDSSGAIVDTLDSTSDRFVPGFGVKAGTAIERVFDVHDGNPLKYLAELGPSARGEELTRVKHTIEPVVKYRYVPDVDQSSTPQFDSLDHLAHRSVVTYGIDQRLFTRFDPRNDYVYGIEEATPEARDLENLQRKSSIDELYTFGFNGDDPDDFRRVISGSKKEFARFKIFQSYDFIEADQNNLPDQSPFSDVNFELRVFPNDYIKVGTRTNIDFDTQEFSSYMIETQLLDKRGDQARLRMNFIDPSVRQLESGIQLSLLDRVKLGYYSRYDDIKSEFIENRLGLRFLSRCNCMIFDVDLRDRINPNDTQISFNLTLIGLGEVGNSLFSLNSKNDNSSF